jgi:DNA-binding HxlR family transcriptional regulator
MKSLEKKPGCIKSALAIVGDKWTPLILSELTECPVAFSDLENRLDSISPRTLSQRLDMLQKEEIITKIQYCEHPPRYKYQLTEKGRELKSVLQAMASWGSKYHKSDIEIKI